MSYLSDALDVWAPTWPRRITRTQEWADSADRAREYLTRAQENGGSPYISVYSFPRGHTKEGHVPRIDTLFIDFDIENGDYEPGSGNLGAWRRDLSKLIVRARKVGRVLEANGSGQWRAALSGHKGIHLFLDFPPLEPDLGTFQQYVGGLNEYANILVEQLANESKMKSLDRFMDVTSSDMGRLCRMPNTIHEGATESFGESRYCVPITIEELTRLTPDLYIELTREPREVQIERNPSENAKEVIRRHVRMWQGRSESNASPATSTSDWRLIDEYKEQSNDDISLGDIKFLTSDRPCVWRYYTRDDKYDHGYQSHYMEMYCIRELLERKVPIDVIKEFLNSAPSYDEAYSERRIKEIIARDYNRFRIDSILQNAPEFCGYEDCAACQRVLDNNE